MGYAILTIATLSLLALSACNSPTGHEGQFALREPLAGIVDSLVSQGIDKPICELYINVRDIDYYETLLYCGDVSLINGIRRLSHEAAVSIISEGKAIPVYSGVERYLYSQAHYERQPVPSVNDGPDPPEQPRFGIYEPDPFHGRYWMIRDSSGVIKTSEYDGIMGPFIPFPKVETVRFVPPEIVGEGA